MSGFSLNDTDLEALAYLAGRASVSAPELARRLKISRQGAHKALTRLVAKGLVTQEATDSGYTYAASAGTHRLHRTVRKRPGRVDIEVVIRCAPVRS
ncbi:MAG: helix-turn-helix domain-containing protein [Candidatus Thermoplasmatota archaeon]|nr:helix-turn-helix domain-containing protein [Candidatus Thermoplasmatota archaeon]